MFLTSQLSSVIYALVFGLLGLLIWKVCTLVYGHLALLKKLSPIPSVPRHWLLGNIQKGQIEDSTSFVELAVKQANDGHKLFCIWKGPFPAVCILHPDTFKELIKQTGEKAKSRGEQKDSFDNWTGDGLLNTEGRKWERNRKLLTPAFHFDILNGYIQTMNEGSNVLLDKLASDTSNGKSVDVFPYICLTTLDAMLKCSLSYEGNLQDNATETEKGYIQAINRMAELIWERALNPVFAIQSIYYNSPMGREYLRLCDRVHAFTRNIIQTRVKNLEQESNITDGKRRRLDFLDILLTAKDSEGHGLSPQEIQDEVDTFTFAGHDTTASAISWSIHALAKYPDLQQKVYEEICNVMGESDVVTKEHIGSFTYLSMFIKEVLRYYSPVPIITRANYDSPVTLDGIEIPAGVSCWVCVYAIHHNENVWPNNMVFDPERFSAVNRDENEIFGFIPFSAGSRNCIGQAFAMNEVKINLAKLVKRFELSLDSTREAELLPDIVMRSKDGIHVHLKKEKINQKINAKMNRRQET